MPDQDLILLQTKLNRPPITRELVVRSRLIERLNSHIFRPLILVSAPAGFGKTTLVCTWLEQMAAADGELAFSFDSAWLSLDEKDNDLNLFLRYFIAALRKIFSGACEPTLELLKSRHQIPLEFLYATFCNDLEALPGECILVLDDYHFIHDQTVHYLLNELVHHWPKQLHLVLISRIDPSLPLSRLRGNGMLGEIRNQELRFNSLEMAAYLIKATMAPLNESILQFLEKRLEGWPAGLHLAALSLRSEHSQESVLSVLSSDNPNITDYLMDEVLTQQVPAVYSFLVQTSILDRFNAALCEALIEETDPTWNAAACLDWIERAELFIIPLDNRREWYRYHHFFQQMLQRKMLAEIAPEQTNQLHRRASIWFEERGLVDEALQHALESGDLGLVARQMYAGLCEVLNREDRPTLDRWLRSLPEEVIQNRPEFLIIRIWSLHFSWRLDLVAQELLRLEELLNSDGGAMLPDSDLQLLRGNILLLKAQRAYFSNQATQAIDLCQEVLKIFPSSWKFVRGGAMMYLGMSLQAIGQALAAEKLLLNEYDDCDNKIDSYALLIVLSLGFVYLNTGQLEQARRMGELLLQGASRGKIANMKNWGGWFLGLVSYHRNDLDTAALHFAHIVEHRFTSQMTVYRDAVAGLALIHQIRGEQDEARQWVESLSQFDLEQRGSEDIRTVSLRARLILLEGDLTRVETWLKKPSDPKDEQPLMWLEEPEVTRALILISIGGSPALEQAHSLLDNLEEIASRTHNSRFKITIQTLRALALNAQGKTSQADDVLKQALELARPGGFIRVFIAQGQPMRKMLHRLAAQGHQVEMIGRILAVFPEVDNHLVTSETPPSQLSPDNSNLVESLTPRELEVLTLLREPFSIKEIALKLNTSYATARRHTINLYGKLGVHKRWDAVSRAITLGILPPE